MSNPNPTHPEDYLYAAYFHDWPVCVGTADYVAKVLGITKQSLYNKAHRTLIRKGRRLRGARTPEIYSYPFIDDEEDETYRRYE